MDDLVQWLREQLDEDERVARAAHAPNWSTDGRRGVHYGVEDGWMTDALTTADADHIAAHDPARVLREIDAKRQLLDDVLKDGHHRSEEDHWYSCAALTDEHGEPLCFDESRAPGPCDCGRDARVARRLRLLALPYADRPGYREEWRP